jgi:hypothetical protein
MKRLLMFLALAGLTVSLLTNARPVTAQNQTPASKEPYSGQPLCQPDAYTYDPRDCVPFGPSTSITLLAQKGIPYPFLPVQASKPDKSLTKVDLKYARVNVPPPDSAKFFSSMDDAISGNNPTGKLQSGKLIYVSYANRADSGGGHYLYLRSGSWVRASPFDEYSQFQ